MSRDDGGGTQWGKHFKAFAKILSEGAVATSLMEACRNALRISGSPMTAIQVRGYLEATGFSFAGYKSNPLSSIHTTLTRLKEGNEVVEKLQSGTKYYQWHFKTDTPPNFLGEFKPPENKNK